MLVPRGLSLGTIYWILKLSFFLLNLFYIYVNFCMVPRYRLYARTAGHSPVFKGKLFFLIVLILFETTTVYVVRSDSEEGEL